MRSGVRKLTWVEAKEWVEQGMADDVSMSQSKGQERLDGEEVAAPEGTATQTSTPAKDAADSTASWPSEADVEAAAKAICENVIGQRWDATIAMDREGYTHEARAALSVVAPVISAVRKANEVLNEVVRTLTAERDEARAEAAAAISSRDQLAEQLGRAQGFATGGPVAGPTSGAKPLFGRGCDYVIPRTRQELISDLAEARAEVAALREEMSKFSGGFEARIASRQELQEQCDHARSLLRGMARKLTEERREISRESLRRLRRMDELKDQTHKLRAGLATAVSRAEQAEAERDQWLGEANSADEDSAKRWRQGNEAYARAVRAEGRVVELERQLSDVYEALGWVWEEWEDQDLPGSAVREIVRQRDELLASRPSGFTLPDDARQQIDSAIRAMQAEPDAPHWTEIRNDTVDLILALVPPLFSSWVGTSSDELSAARRRITKMQKRIDDQYDWIRQIPEDAAKQLASQMPSSMSDVKAMRVAVRIEHLVRSWVAQGGATPETPAERLARCPGGSDCICGGATPRAKGIMSKHMAAAERLRKWLNQSPESNYASTRALIGVRTDDLLVLLEAIH